MPAINPNTEKVIVFDTSRMTAPVAGSDINASRGNVYNSYRLEGQPKVSIAVLAYNRLEKTKYCVECILKYTVGIPYELILIDNGSSDGTLEYFKSVQYDMKTIYHVTNNVGSMFGTSLPFDRFLGDYLVSVNQDIYVTENWLDNMLSCIESDRRIGMVSPMSSNVSNLQNPGLEFCDMEEMQRAAKLFNTKNPRLWQERTRLMPTILMVRRETLDLTGKWDVGFFHDFSDDDISYRIRRAGYKLMLCGDVFVHHDHTYGFDGFEKMQESMHSGLENFVLKYHGINPINDAVNFERGLINLMPIASEGGKKTVLGVDVLCGMPLLEIKNRLRLSDTEASLTAFTENSLYYTDLCTICDEGAVFNGRVERLEKTFLNRKFDIIILGSCINAYPNYECLIKSLCELVAPGGFLLVKFKNFFNPYTFLSLIGVDFRESGENYSIISPSGLLNELIAKGMTFVDLSAIGHDVSEKTVLKIRQVLESTGACENIELTYNKLTADEYYVCVRKN